MDNNEAIMLVKSLNFSQENFNTLKEFIMAKLENETLHEQAKQRKKHLQETVDTFAAINAECEAERQEEEEFQQSLPKMSQKPKFELSPNQCKNLSNITRNFQEDMINNIGSEFEDDNYNNIF